MEEDSSGLERELKFAGVDLEDLREKLLRLEAESDGPPALEDNWIFDRGGELQKSRSVLRLRYDRRGTRLTFKGPPKFEGSVKIRSEHETKVEDAPELRRILAALGYEPVRRYQKYREEWRLGSLTIALDHTPIGDFLEIEGEGCETIARRLGLENESAERRNYLRLYEDHLKEHPDATPDMIFRESED